MDLGAVVVGGIFACLFVLICIYSGYKAVKDRQRIIKKNARIRENRLKEQQSEDEEQAKEQDDHEQEGVTHDIVEYSKDLGINFLNNSHVPNGKGTPGSLHSSSETIDKVEHGLTGDARVTTVTIETGRSSSHSNLLGGVEGKESEDDSGISRGDSRRRRSSRFKKKKKSASEERDGDYGGCDNPSLTPDDVYVTMETPEESVFDDAREFQVSTETQTDIVAVRTGLNLRSKERVDASTPTMSVWSSPDADKYQVHSTVTDPELFSGVEQSTQEQRLGSQSGLPGDAFSEDGKSDTSLDNIEREQHDINERTNSLCVSPRITGHDRRGGGGSDKNTGTQTQRGQNTAPIGGGGSNAAGVLSNGVQYEQKQETMPGRTDSKFPRKIKTVAGNSDAMSNTERPPNCQRLSESKDDEIFNV